MTRAAMVARSAKTTAAIIGLAVWLTTEDGHFAPRLGLVRTGVFARPELTHGFVQEVFVDLGAEDFVGQLYFADLLVLQIHYIKYWHRRYLLDLRTST